LGIAEIKWHIGLIYNLNRHPVIGIATTTKYCWRKFSKAVRLRLMSLIRTSAFWRYSAFSRLPPSIDNANQKQLRSLPRIVYLNAKVYFVSTTFVMTVFLLI
jgi:hypothetical protein